MEKDRKNLFKRKKNDFNQRRRAEHLFAGQNTAQAGDY